MKTKGSEPNNSVRRLIALGVPYESGAIARQIGKAAAVQAAANTGAQGLNIEARTQEHFDPAEVAQSAGMGAVFGAVHPAITGLHVTAEGGAKVPAQPHGLGENVLNRETGARIDPWAPVPEPQVTGTEPQVVRTASVPSVQGDGQAPPAAPAPEPRPEPAPEPTPAVPSPEPAPAAIDPNLATVTTTAGRDRSGTGNDRIVIVSG